MASLQQLPFTAAAVALAVAGGSYMVATGGDIVHVEFFADATRPVHWFDEFGMALLLLSAGAATDRAVAGWRLRRAAERDRRDAELQAERLRVLKATMRTVQDIVNNFLTSLQWVRLEGEGRLAPETLQLLDALTYETAAKLKALGDLETVPARPMAIGEGIAFEGEPATGDGAPNRARPMGASAPAR